MSNTQRKFSPLPILFSILIITLVLSACSVPPKLTTNITLLKESQNSQLPNEKKSEFENNVRLYFGYNFPLHKKLIRFATITVKGESNSNPFMIITELENKANEMGADAVIEIKVKNSSAEDITGIDGIFQELSNDSLEEKILTGVLVKYGE